MIPPQVMARRPTYEPGDDLPTEQPITEDTNPDLCPAKSCDLDDTGHTAHRHTPPDDPFRQAATRLFDLHLRDP